MDEGDILFLSGKKSEALNIFVDAMKNGGDRKRCLMAIGSCLLSLGRHRDAADVFSVVEGESELKSVALLNQGIAMSICGDDGTAHIDKAMELMPEQPFQFHLGRIMYRGSKCLAHFAKATSLQKNMRNREAMEELELSFGRKHEMSFCGLSEDLVKLELAYCRMREGILDDRSWALHESRWIRVGKAMDPPSSISDPNGKTVMIYSEQGFGDSIQFVRFAKGLKEKGAERVILVTRPQLKRLFSCMDCLDQVVSGGEPHSRYDLHMPIMSLPYALGIGGDIEKYSSPYLKAEAEASRRMSLLMPEGFKVGLVWSGNPRDGEAEEIKKRMERRNVSSIQLVESLGNIRKISLVSLQKDETNPPRGVLNLMHGVEDYADTAAIISNLDAVVSVDTSVAHLAAAMGKPTFMLSRVDGCWRWGSREKCLVPKWYPSMRIYRQEKIGDWREEIHRLTNDLQEMIGGVN